MDTHPGLRVLNTPIGQLLLAASEVGLRYIVFENEGIEDRAAQILAEGLLATDSTVVDRAATQLVEYFAGERTGFEIPLDRQGSGFHAEVRRVLEDVGYGETVSYTELATRAGRPSAVRAAGTACATNPLPIVVPCHRVLRRDGALGGYRGGTEAKAWLLYMERTHRP